MLVTSVVVRATVIGEPVEVIVAQRSAEGSGSGARPNTATPPGATFTLTFVHARARDEPREHAAPAALGIEHVKVCRDAEPAGPADKTQLEEARGVAASREDSTPWRNGTVSIAPTTMWPPVACTMGATTERAMT